MTQQKFFLLPLLSASSLLIGGCSPTWLDNNKEKAQGERIPILETQKFTQANSHNPIIFSPPEKNTVWEQTARQANHQISHLSLAANPDFLWKKKVGASAGTYTPIISQPIVGDGLIYFLDSHGLLSATSLENGTILWTRSVSQGKTDDFIGGGLAFAEGKVFVTSPHAQLVAFDGKTGAELWRAPLHGPSRTPPTVNGRHALVLTISNDLLCFSTETGELLWTHTGGVETTEILGGGSAAIVNGVVIVAYSSGEVFALKEENGQTLWHEGLLPHFEASSASAIPHIRAYPVVSQDTVYISSHSGKTAAISLTTGQEVWQQPVGGIEPPLVDGNHLFILNGKDELLCLERTTGQVLWSSFLKEYSLEEKSPLWFGPVLAGGHLILSSSHGHLLFLDSEGKIVHSHKEKKGFPVAPIVASDTLIIINNEGELTAYR